MSDSEFKPISYGDLKEYYENAESKQEEKQENKRGILEEINNKLGEINSKLSSSNLTGSGKNNKFYKLLEKTSNLDKKKSGLIHGFYLNFDSLQNNANYNDEVTNNELFLDKSYFEAFNRGLLLSDKKFSNKDMSLYLKIEKIIN